MFNNTHPELKDDEVFIINHNPKENAMVNFNNLPYKSKRLGKVAYGANGEVLPGLQPVFVSRIEHEDCLNRNKIKKAYLMTGFHPLSHKRNEKAEILGVVFYPLKGDKPQACFHIQFDDGKEDYVAVCDSEYYKIILGIEIEIENQISN